MFGHMSFVICVKSIEIHLPSYVNMNLGKIKVIKQINVYMFLFTLLLDDKTGWFTGDPHFVTFDGETFDYQGTCQYIVTELCTAETSLPYFQLIGGFSKRFPTDSVTWTDSIELLYDGQHYEILADGTVMINKKKGTSSQYPVRIIKGPSNELVRLNTKVINYLGLSSERPYKIPHICFSSKIMRRL